MAKINDSNVLSEEFIADLFATCMKNQYVLSVVYQNLKSEHLPDKSSAAILSVLKRYYRKFGKCPSLSAAMEMLSGDRHAADMLRDLHQHSLGMAQNECLILIEQYLKRVTFMKVYKEVGVLFNRKKFDKAKEEMYNYVKWENTFSLTESEFVDVVDTFKKRFYNNRDLFNSESKVKPITRFYIDELDKRNEGLDLRTQLTCILASTGVGKSHAARWVGRCACLDGFNVLQFQLEGSKKEVTDAYSASLALCNVRRYENGSFTDDEIEEIMKGIGDVKGQLYVKSYSKFNNKVSTMDIKNDIEQFKLKYGIRPDIIIIDSMDLLNDASGKIYSDNGERHKRTAVARDLKDLAADENVWVVATYQSVIHSYDWLNDESNVLSENDLSESKGLSRPLTHLISLNQSRNEKKEQVMRINVAKSRFFHNGEPFKIATDYSHEMFYDRIRTMNINKVN